MRSIIGVVLTLCLGLVQAQNLVPNPGFESYQQCPGTFSQAPHEFRVEGWRSATLGTPDYFNTCSNGEANVPHNWAGVSDACEGKGYAGIYTWSNADSCYREYLQCTLTEPLIKDSVYQISFRYKLSSYSKYSIDRMGLFISNRTPGQRSDDVLRIDPTLSVIRDSALTRSTGLWEKAQMAYKASGGEQYVTIGNFFDNAATHYYHIEFRPASQEMLAESAYYYIDDVRVIPLYRLKEMESLVPEFSLPEVKLNTTYVLRNIQFDFNSYKLIPPSFEELEQVAAFLFRNPKVKVHLAGHTDDRGVDTYNLKLSENRAKNAAAYIAKLGIDLGRIEVSGYGESRPLVEGKTENARMINRRVEIRFFK
jgi:outer membrane protein OmpA-like peptidoglycan-associated protein